MEQVVLNLLLFLLGIATLYVVMVLLASTKLPLWDILVSSVPYIIFSLIFCITVYELYEYCGPAVATGYFLSTVVLLWCIWRMYINKLKYGFIKVVDYNGNWSGNRW